MLKKRFLIGLCSLLLVFGMAFLPMGQAAAFTEEQSLLLQSWRLVNQAYVDDSFNDQNWWLIRQQFLKRPLSNREETYEAIAEMLAVLDDPYTRLLRPDQYHSLQVNTSGELSGVGLQISTNPETGILEVIVPLAGSPAEAAGIQPRDRIIAIDGIETKNLSLDEAAAHMRGKKGTSVALTVQSPGTEKVRTVEVVRDIVSLNPVFAKLETYHDQKVGYVRLNQFSANAREEIAQAVTNLQAQGADRYVLDLRNNPGGLLQAGIEIARLWLDQETIVYTVNRQGVLDSFVGTGHPLSQAPLAVLVNQATASASEILAGALQDNHRALLIGEKTFGKGLIQSLFELSDGSGIAVTVAQYETPEHHNINQLGIVPDRIIPQDPIPYRVMATEDDAQYQAALGILTEEMTLADKDIAFNPVVR